MKGSAPRDFEVGGKRSCSHRKGREVVDEVQEVFKSVECRLAKINPKFGKAQKFRKVFSELQNYLVRLDTCSDDSYTHIDYMDTAYFDLLLKFGPIRRNRNGRGVQSNDNPAKRDVAPCIVKALYICNAKSG